MCHAMCYAGRWFLLALSVLVTGCVVNPVTGKTDFITVSTAQDLEMGRQQYRPSQQMQGGTYDLDPALTAYVSEVGKKLGAVSDVQLPYEFAVLNNGVPNAWALPGGKIALNRGLLVELHSEAELAAVLGHEITHAAARHTAQQISRGQLAQIGILATAIGVGGRQGAELAVGGAQLGAQLVMQHYGRDAESEADHYGMLYMKRAGYDPSAAVSLQETFVRLFDGKQAGWLSGLFAGHPPSRERVAANRKTLQEIGAGGELGKEKFTAALAGLRRSAPAYAKNEEAQKALVAGRIDDAQRLNEEARRIEPREAMFAALAGDIKAKRGDLRGAIPQYDKAVALNDRFFAYPLMRGLARLKLGERAEGERDLRASVALLPTAVAANELGKIALARGDTGEARKYLLDAASVEGDVGNEARGELARLDIGTEPDKVVALEAFVDAGQLGAQVTNKGPFAVNDIVIEFLSRDPTSGQVVRSEKRLQSLGSGQTTTVPSGLAVNVAQPEVRISVLRAEPAPRVAN